MSAEFWSRHHICPLTGWDNWKGNTVEPKKALQVAVEDAEQAAWRTAGAQFVKLTRDPMVAMLCRHISPNDESIRVKLAAFLETEVGGAMLSAFLSLALSALPKVGGDVPAKLARELRVRAMSDVGDVLADLLMGPLREVMVTYLSGVGSETKLQFPMPEMHATPVSFDNEKIHTTKG